MADTSSEAKQQLQPYSLGISGVNKDLNSDDIEVLLVEHFPMVDGELTDNGTSFTVSGTDALGNAYSVSIAQSSTVKATWKRMGDTNRTTSPDIRRGEHVQVWRYADADTYYWTALNDGTKRRLETVTHAWSGTQDETTTKLDGSNSYYFEASTHNGYIHLHTSKANGEKYAYDFQIDAKNGNFSIRDDIGNGISCDSTANTLTMINSQGTSLEINQKNATLTVPDTYTINGKTIKVNCTDYTLTAGNSITANGPTITVSGTTGTVKFSNLSITAQTTHNGNLGLNGNLTTAPGSGGATGQIEMQGDAIMHGNMTIDGIVTAKQGAVFGGTVQAEIIISNQDIQAPNV